MRAELAEGSDRVMKVPKYAPSRMRAWAMVAFLRDESSIETCESASSPVATHGPRRPRLQSKRSPRNSFTHKPSKPQRTSDSLARRVHLVEV